MFDKEISMEWNNDLCLKLIKYYRQHRCLWDPTYENYKNSTKNENAWKAIGNHMECRVDEIRRKMDSLLASYRRERQKSMLPTSGSAADNVYKSKWFAYSTMQFLLHKYKARTICKKIHLQSNKTVESTIVEPIQSVSSHQMEFKLPTKKDLKREIDDDPRVDDAYKFFKETSSNRIDRDESSVFGEHVAMKLRKYSAYTKSTVEHLISNILYEADMGEYNEPHLTQSPSIYSQQSQSTLYSQQSPPSSLSPIPSESYS